MGLTIRETTANDLPDLGRLWNDGTVMQWVGFPDGLGYDEEALRKWFDALRSNTDVRHFVIRDSDLGFCGELFYRLDPEHRRAELDIKLVPEAQGEGSPPPASREIELVFEREPSADTVWTEPTPENRASRALYARCGLTETNRPADLRPGRPTGRSDACHRPSQRNPSRSGDIAATPAASARPEIDDGNPVGSRLRQSLQR